ncbi:hypothetical protein FIU97_16970 [Roseivivax sp. THAF40]|uniref:ATP-binding protein n=1 Tax=unclassified Roseivivax TaxID=2639302 RepID=UPI0012A907E5|nr:MULTISPECIES: ATP-binding protein [unclassified Roseivivax]QFS84450.1 hypothetical protein FIV09_16555 [Roseivivax sp. THAF197b]QFT48278.1 hypothetical protein FIU97_16970 [Roseivivax sp. THAF40]
MSPWRYPVANNPRDVRRTCVAVEADLRAAGVSSGAAARMELICAEVLNNIVEHAMPGQPDGWIELQIDLAAPGRLTFLDNGAPMPDGGRRQISDPDMSCPPDMNGPKETLPEGGYGWLLIRSLAEHVEYDRTDGKNSVRITLPPDLS